MKKVIKLAFVAAFVAVAGYGIYANQTSDAISDLALANVDALAAYEGGGSPCGGPKDAPVVDLKILLIVRIQADASDFV